MEHPLTVQEIITNGTEHERHQLRRQMARFACALNDVLPPDFAKESLEDLEASVNSVSFSVYRDVFLNSTGYVQELLMNDLDEFREFNGFTTRYQHNPASLIEGHLLMGNLLRRVDGQKTATDVFNCSLPEFLSNLDAREDFTFGQKITIITHLPGILAQIINVTVNSPNYPQVQEGATELLMSIKNPDTPDLSHHTPYVLNVLNLLRECHYAARDKSFCEENIRALKQFYAANKYEGASAIKALGRIFGVASGHAKRALQKPSVVVKDADRARAIKPNAARAGAQMLMFMSAQFLIDDLSAGRDGISVEDFLPMLPAIVYQPGKRGIFTQEAANPQDIAEQVKKRRKEVALDWHVLYPGTQEGADRQERSAALRAQLIKTGVSPTHDFSRIEFLEDIIDMFDATKTSDDPPSYIAWSRSKDIDAGRPPQEARDLWCFAVLVDAKDGTLKEHVVADNAYTGKQGSMHSLHCLRAEVGDWTAVFKETTKPAVRNRKVRTIRHRGDVAGRVLEYLVREPQYLGMQYRGY